MGVLRSAELFDEVSLYGALIHVVAAEVETLKFQIQELLEAEGIVVRGQEVITPSLEDVFIASVRS
jgi:regulator of replication initiation timing